MPAFPTASAHLRHTALRRLRNCPPRLWRYQNLALEAQLESSRSREENMAKKVARSQEDLEALRAEIEQMKKLLGLDKKEKAVKTRATNP